MQPSQYPEPGKIHKLPIQVYYNIPSSEHTFVTTLETPQSVFVHPPIPTGTHPILRSTRSQSAASRRDVRGSSDTSRKRRKLDVRGRGYAETTQGSDSAEDDDEGNDENEQDDDSEDEEGERCLVLGSTSLKVVMDAVCKASPELLPSANTSDSSVYIPVDQPKSSRGKSTLNTQETSSRGASVAPGSALVVPKTEPLDPVSCSGQPSSASLPVTYPYGAAPVFSPATGQYLYPYAQPGPPQSASRRNNSTGNAHQASTPSAAAPSSPLPQRTVSNSTTGSHAQTPSNAGLQTPTHAHANANAVGNARDSFSGMPPPSMGQRANTAAVTPAPITAVYPHPPHGQPYGYPYSSPYPGYPGHASYPGFPQYPGHPPHPGYQPNGAPVPILVPVPAPQPHGPSGTSSATGPMSSPYPYYAPGAAYPHGVPAPPHMPGYPYPIPSVYHPTPPGQASAPPDPTGAASALGIQGNHVTFQGKGLLSWILAERGDGKTLVKGKIVKCNDWDGVFGLDGVDDSDQSDDENGQSPGDDNLDGEGGLEALVKAAARRNERKRKREERERSLAEHLDSGQTYSSQSRESQHDRTRVRWGIEIRVNLRTVNGPVPSRMTASTLQPSPTLNAAKVSVSHRSNTSATSSTRTTTAVSSALGRPGGGGPASRAGSALPAQPPKPVAGPSAKAQSVVPSTTAGQKAPTKQPASFINGQLQDSRLAGAVPPPAVQPVQSVRKTAESVSQRSVAGLPAMPAANGSVSGPANGRSDAAGLVPKSAARTIARPNARVAGGVPPQQPAASATAPSIALRRFQQNPENRTTPNEATPRSTPTPSISMPLKTGITLDSALRTPPERPVAPLNNTNRTPNAKPSHLPNVTSADRVDPLRTPRQATNRKNLPTPKSSPATGLALAKSILRYPASQHTIELAQKLVGREVFDNIVSEMGLQPVDVIRHSPSKTKLSRLSESTSTTVVLQTQTHAVPARAKAANPMENPLLDPGDQARVALPGSQGSNAAPKQSGSVSRVSNHHPSGSNPSATNPAATSNGKPKILSCDHCKTTQTRVWRVKQLPGGKERRVCDACGLYFNTTKKMRPKELWGTQQTELPGSSVTTRKQAAATTISKGKEKEEVGLSVGRATVAGQPAPVPVDHDINASPQRKARPSIGAAPDSANWTPRRSSRLNPNVDSSPTGRAPVLHHKPALDEVCEAAMSPRRSTRLTPRKVSKGQAREGDVVMVAGKAQKRLMELTKEPSVSSPRRSLTSALAAVAGGGHGKHQPHATTTTTEENVWDDNDFSFLLSDNIDEIQDSGNFATDPMASSSGLDYEMEQFLNPTSASGGEHEPSGDEFDANALLIAGEDHEPKFTQKEMELLVMLSASGIASEELGMDVAEDQNMEPINAMAGPSRQGNALLDGTEWTDESSPWEISTPSGGGQWKMS